jgi:hypothetical protein
MSQARVGIPFKVIDNPEMGPQEIFLWAKLAVLQNRQRTDSIDLGKGFKRVRQLTGMQSKTIRKLIVNIMDYGYMQQTGEWELTFIDGARHSGKESVAVKNQVPKETSTNTTTPSVDSDESPVERSCEKKDCNLNEDGACVNALKAPRCDLRIPPVVDDSGELKFTGETCVISSNVGPISQPEEDFTPIIRIEHIWTDKQAFADSVFDNWKAFAEWANSEGAFSQRVAAPRKTTKSIRRKILARFKDPPWQGDYWPPMLEKLKTLKPHWRGEGDWVINLEYLVRNDGQAEKLVNGEWSEAAQPKSSEPSKADLAEFNAAMDKMEKETPW